jgi:hypothetical protein
MHAPILRRALGLLAVPALACVVLTGCGHSHDSAKAAAAASSAEANPTYSADVAQLENELTANLKTYFSAAHPIDSTKKAVQVTFPGTDVGKIETYAVKTFTPGVGHKGQTRTRWVNGVVTYALDLGSAGIPSPGTASIPAAAPASPSPSASKP